jgi:hypothetical protein
MSVRWLDELVNEIGDTIVFVKGWGDSRATH